MSAALPVPVPILTKESVLALGPGQEWRQGGIDRYLAGRESVPVDEVLLDERRALISEADQRWLAAALLGSRAPEWAGRCADHVVQLALDSGHAEWREWARRWLSGEDRSGAAARAAAAAEDAWAAWAAARTAWAAATAREAAWAAATAREAEDAWAELAAATARTAWAAWAAAAAAELAARWNPAGHRWQMLEAIRMLGGD